MELASFPQNERELLMRAHQMAGLSLSELALQHHLNLPPDLKRAKGFIGQLIEKHLGATAGVKSAPDFEALGIELKTIPINAKGEPCETTYVCRVPMLNAVSMLWRESSVYRKLARVLWLPIEGERSIPLAKRRIGTACLWSPSVEEEAILRQDWEEFMEKICLGEVESITGHQGLYLQVRPKAPHSRATRKAVDEAGAMTTTLPRGFYLRTSFTAAILRRAYFL